MIQWVERELQLLAARIIELMRANPSMSMFKACREAQALLPSDRKRVITGEATMPRALREEVKRRMNMTSEQKAKLPENQPKVSESELLLDFLESFIVRCVIKALASDRASHEVPSTPVAISLPPLQDFAHAPAQTESTGVTVPKHTPEPLPSLKPKPTVLIIGLHPHERTSIESQLGKFLRIKFWNGEFVSLAEKAMLSERIYILGNTAINGHPAVVALQKENERTLKIKSIPQGKAPDVIALIRQEFEDYLVPSAQPQA